MKLRHFLSLFFLLLLLAAAGRPTQAQSFQWAKLARGAIDSAAVALQASATDVAGNTYVAVQFRDSLRAGSFLLSTVGSRSVGLVKYDSTGVVRWAKLLRNITIAKMAADNSAGEVYLTAAISSAGGGTWDGTALPLPANTVLYGKYTSAGALLWTQPLPVYSSASYGPSVVADAAGNGYLLGTAASNTTFINTTLLQGQALVCKISGAGSPQWVQVLHGSTANSFYSNVLGPKPGGGCLVSGQVAGPLYLGAGTGTTLVTARLEYDFFLTSFDAAGAHQWSRLVGNAVAGSSALGTVGAAAADASGNCYITGNASNALPWNGSVLNGYFLAKYDAAGALQWVRSAIGATLGTGVLAVANAEPTVAVSTYAINNQQATVGTLTLRAPFNFVHYTAQGQEKWAVADSWPGAANPTPPYFLPQALGADARGNLYPVGRPSFPRFRGVSTPVPAVVLGSQTTVGNGIIVSRLNAYANTLRGLVYFDQNANGQQDAGEGAFPRQLSAVLVQGIRTSYTPTGSNGEVQAYANPGAYSLALGSVPDNYTVTQPSSGSYAGTFSGSSQLVGGLTFGIAPVVNRTDVRITLTPYGMARPGFTTRYRATVENVGTTTVAAGTASVTLDSRASFVSSTPSGTRTGQTISWSYANLAPFDRLDYDVLFSLPTNTALGTVLSSTAAAPLAADLAPADNTAQLNQTVVGAYDPNDIEVNYQRLTPAQVAAQQPLDYTIHFQNLGTAEAVNIMLSDTLDYRKFSLSSLLLVAQSHNCNWSLSSTGPNAGVLTVRFLNINLPERNADVIRSQGFVRFRVQPRNTLAVGETIPNRASIVFDYNAPVRTNVATTTVLLASAAQARHDAPAWTAYPNPATDAVTVATDLATAGPVRLELLDVLGRPVRQQTLTAPAGPLRQTLDLRGLPAGLYLLRLTPPTGPTSSQQVVRE